MKEEDLAKPIISWLEEQHWDVYQEVQFGRGGKVADIVAVRNGLVWIIECKTTFSLAVMGQAFYWRSHFRSVAVPTTLRADRWLAYRICKNYLKVGVLEVGEYNEVFSKVSPPLMREHHELAKSYREYLSPEHKVYAQAGAKNGGHFTPYKKTMRDVKNYIAQNPGCTLKEIIDTIGHGHYAHPQSARGTIRTALIEWESDWCYVDTGEKTHRYYLQTHLLEAA